MFDEERDHWFTKWLLGLGVLLPLFGYWGLTGYAPSQSFLWNAVNQQVEIGFIGANGELSCSKYLIDRYVNSAYGSTVAPAPAECRQPLRMPYLYVLAAAAFCLMLGVYFWMEVRAEPEVELPDRSDLDAEEKREADFLSGLSFGKEHLPEHDEAEADEVTAADLATEEEAEEEKV